MLVHRQRVGCWLATHIGKERNTGVIWIHYCKAEVGVKTKRSSVLFYSCLSCHSDISYCTSDVNTFNCLKFSSNLPIFALLKICNNFGFLSFLSACFSVLCTTLLLQLILYLPRKSVLLYGNDSLEVLEKASVFSFNDLFRPPSSSLMSSSRCWKRDSSFQDGALFVFSGLFLLCDKWSWRNVIPPIQAPDTTYGNIWGDDE